MGGGEKERCKVKGTRCTVDIFVELAYGRRGHSVRASLGHQVGNLER